MAQYVYQVINIDGKWQKGRLLKSFKVSEKSPIPSYIPTNIKQLVSEDTKMFNAAVAFYELHTTNAKYTITGDQIVWELR